MRKLRRIPALVLALAVISAPAVLADTAGVPETGAAGQVLQQAPGEAAQIQTAAAEQGNTQEGAAQAEKPEPASVAAVLYDATTKQFLFEKNPDQALYPASITKVMTVLLAAEKLSPENVITFQASATDNLESGYTNVQMVAGDTMSVKDAMYAVLLKSACEVSNGLAEQVSGSQSAFAELMNSRAAELGCTNTCFRNASGLNDAGHYTTAHDMALITAAAFANTTFRTVASTKKYTLPASKKRAGITVTNSNKMLSSSNAEYMEGIVGGKTGYTTKAGNTLVEVLDYQGHELVAVVMKSSGRQYSDAKVLLEYGKVLVDGLSTAQAVRTGKWERTAEGNWKYRFSDGTYAASEWLCIGENEYYFGTDCLMATGWKRFTNGAWYYFDKKAGAMVHDKWVSPDGDKYYYLQSNGVLATDTVIGGVYRVDANGVYVEKVG